MAAFYPINAPLVNYFFQNYTETLSGAAIPLAGGKVFFFEDNDHTVEKPTYSNVFDPANPVVNTNPLVLNVAGATPIYYAEPGLYYIVVTGPDGNLNNPIWTFEHVNFEGGAGNGGENIINYIPNGQFLLYQYFEGTSVISKASTDIAYGGWTFERPADSTADDNVFFQRYNQWVADPSGNPRWAVNLVCENPDSGDAYKDIRIKFNDVNRFASATQKYTFSFNGLDNLAGNAPVDLYVIKNFGTGGSPTTETLIETFNLGATPTNLYIAFTFGTNAGKVIGTQDDDYIQLALRFRTNEPLNVVLTDMQMQAGDLASPVYPETTQKQDVAQALAGSIPIPDVSGFNIGLSPILTLSGWQFDDSMIGKVFESATGIVEFGELYCDGAQYNKRAYSSDGIPYARLQRKLSDPNNAYLPRYGTGPNYFSCINLAANALTVLNNTAGAATAATDGSIATGFSFSASLPGGKRQNVITTVAASAMPDGCFFNIYGFSSVSIPYYFYYVIDGVDTDPNVAGAQGFPVAINSTDIADEVAEKTCFEINTALFCVPDYRGLFFRAWDDGAGRDPDAASRTALGGTPGVGGDEVGTYQSDQFKSHIHQLSNYNVAASQSGGGATIDVISGFTPFNTTATGGNETRPINAYVMPVIKY
jgi:hypothetical protein